MVCYSWYVTLINKRKDSIKSHEFLRIRWRNGGMYGLDFWGVKHNCISLCSWLTGTLSTAQQSNILYIVLWLVPIDNVQIRDNPNIISFLLLHIIRRELQSASMYYQQVKMPHPRMRTLSFARSYYLGSRKMLLPAIEFLWTTPATDCLIFKHYTWFIVNVAAYYYIAFDLKQNTINTFIIL